MDYEQDDRRAAGPDSPGAEEGTRLPTERGPRAAAPGDGPSDLGALDADASGSMLDDDLASVLMPGGLLPPVLADVDRDLGFPPPQAPDLASAFLAALDAVDDRRFVTPPPPDELPPPPATIVAHASEVHEQKDEKRDDKKEERVPVAGLLTMGERAPVSSETAPSEDAAIDPTDEPSPMTVAEWAAAFEAVQQAASGPGAFEDGAPLDMTVEQDEDGDVDEHAAQHTLFADDMHVGDVGHHAGDTPDQFRAREAHGNRHDTRAVQDEREHDAHEYDAQEAHGAFSDYDDVPFGAAPVRQDSMRFDAATGFEEPPVVLGKTTTFDEPASIDMPVPLDTSTDDEAVEAEPEPDVLEDLQEFVVFSLGDLRCVVPIRSVIEVGRIPEAATVPNAPPWLHGLGNLRGQVLTLIDLRAFFGVGRVKPSTGRMVVLRADTDDVTAAVMVDQVHQIVSLSPSRFKEAPSTLPERSSAFVWGACDYGNYTMIGLDVDGVLGVESTPEQQALA